MRSIRSSFSDLSKLVELQKKTLENDKCSDI